MDCVDGVASSRSAHASDVTGGEAQKGSVPVRRLLMQSSLSGSLTSPAQPKQRYGLPSLQGGLPTAGRGLGLSECLEAGSLLLIHKHHVLPVPTPLQDANTHWFGRQGLHAS